MKKFNRQIADQENTLRRSEERVLPKSIYRNNDPRQSCQLDLRVIQAKSNCNRRATPQEIEQKSFQNNQNKYCQPHIIESLQQISKDIVESLTKALTPNRPGRVFTQKEVQIQPDPPQMILQEELKGLQPKKYINFKKFARDLMHSPLKQTVINEHPKMSRQRSQDFIESQEKWVRAKNDKVFRLRLRQQESQQLIQGGQTSDRKI